MTKTLLLDIGMTVYIKNEQGSGIINPLIRKLLKKIPPEVKIVPISDTSLKGVPEILVSDFPEMAKNPIFVKERFPWINKEDPDTYIKVCEMIGEKTENCILLDDREEFRRAATATGIVSFGVTPDEITRCLTYLVK